MMLVIGGHGAPDSEGGNYPKIKKKRSPMMIGGGDDDDIEPGESEDQPDEGEGLKEEAVRVLVKALGIPEANLMKVKNALEAFVNAVYKGEQSEEM